MGKFYLRTTYLCLWFLQANVPMKYYNCRNNGGFNVDGQMSTNENNFDNRLCTWEMVTGNSGTFLRIFDFNFTDLDPEDDFQSWYYDNSSPDTTNSAPAAALGAPWFPNANFALCTGLLDQQVYLYSKSLFSMVLYSAKKFLLEIFWIFFCTI